MIQSLVRAGEKRNSVKEFTTTSGVVVKTTGSPVGLNGQSVLSVMGFDVDDSLTGSGEFAERYELPAVKQFAREHGFPEELVLEPHQTIEDRTIKDVLFVFPEIAYRLEQAGEPLKIDPDRCTQLQIEYLQGRIRLERNILALQGVQEGLDRIKQQHPRKFRLAYTNCPNWLALARLHYAGLLKDMDGVVAIAPEVPQHLRDTRWWTCVEAALDWLPTVWNSFPHENLQVVASVPLALAKPNPTGLQAALEVICAGGKLLPCENVVIYGDTIATDGRAAYDLFPGAERARFIHTLQAAKANMSQAPHANAGRSFPPIDAIVHAFAQVPTILSKWFGGVAEPAMA